MKTTRVTKTGLALILVGLVLGVYSCKDTPPERQKDAQTADKETEAASIVKQVPIPLTLPKPMFAGTPQNLSGVPNLEKTLNSLRPLFLAPEGTTNVAAGKTVTSSDEYPMIGDVDMITDGDKDGAEGSFVELGLFKQSVTVDLGEQHKIYAVVVWHFHNQPRVYYDVVTQISDDPNFTANVTTIFNNDTDNSLELGAGSDKHYIETSEGKLMDARSTQGRYVRCYSNGNNANELSHFIEVEVFGTPVE
jgi:hypothetical protein